MLLRVVAAAVIAAVGGSFVAEAQTMREIGGPKELPPASFTANQYVDSRGCVFLRAGYGDRVNWVPRVTRDRKVLCGYEPSLKVASAAKATSTPKPASGNVGKPTETVAVKTTPPRIKTTTAPVAVASYAPAPVRPAAASAAIAPAAPAPQAPVAAGQGLCTERSAVAQRFMVDDGRHPVRCGPQAGRSSGTGALASGDQAQSMGRVATATPAPVIPKGYKAAWTDGRLNPNRGNGTAAGKAAMDLIWTQETPRRLIDVTTGHEVTGQHPWLVYPYTDYALQQRTQATRTTVSTKGASAQIVATAAVKTSVSTKSQATARVVPAQTGKAYVQAGSFGVASNAAGAVARLRSLGLPVATSTLRKGGKSLQIVLAGPFTNQSDLGAALARARQAGFSDAFLRH